MNVSLSDYYKEYKDKYKSTSQLIRRVSENWFFDNMYCPFCIDGSIIAYENNHPVVDFCCHNCNKEYQLKAKKYSFGNKLLDGEYHKMIDAIYSKRAPNFFLLSYTPGMDRIINLILVPKEFILPGIIEKRNPLSQNARRHGWTGCNIILESIPAQGKIYSIENGVPIDKDKVRKNVTAVDYFMKINNVEARGWLNDILLIISGFRSEIFTLKDLYEFIPRLRKLYPNNNNIEAKIRQQLQILRDNDIIEFIGRGVYKKRFN